MNLSVLTPIREKLENHEIFTKINSVADLVVFMEHHVFAVWDFMSLLKKLQFDLVPKGSPWIPNPNGNLVRFVNEIVMEEESDLAYGIEDGSQYKSHFEIYLTAMQEVGASTERIEEFLSIVGKQGLWPALEWPGVPEPSRIFMKHTFDLIEKGKPHQIAASFAIARESVVPLMFDRILKHSTLDEHEAPTFRYYLKRHTELDGDHHAPMAERLLANLCDGDAVKSQEVVEQATDSIIERIRLWDRVEEALPGRSAKTQTLLS